MELKNTIDIIIKDLYDARDIIDDLKKYPGVPVLQVELAKSKCKSAADVIALLKTLPVLSTPSHEPETVITVVKSRDPEPDIRVENSTVKEIADPIIEHAPLMAAAEDKPEVHVKKAGVIVPTEEPKIKTGPVTTKKSPEPIIIADKFPKPASFNEELGIHKHDDDLLESLRTKPLTFLTEAIGINDKFLFIREVFNGNPNVYNQAIQRLESAVDFSEAKVIIADYTEESDDNQALAQLMDLIKRKFPSNE